MKASSKPSAETKIRQKKRNRRVDDYGLEGGNLEAQKEFFWRLRKVLIRCESQDLTLLRVSGLECTSKHCSRIPLPGRRLQFAFAEKKVEPIDATIPFSLLVKAFIFILSS